MIILMNETIKKNMRRRIVRSVLTNTDDRVYFSSAIITFLSDTCLCSLRKINYYAARRNNHRIRHRLCCTRHYCNYELILEEFLPNANAKNLVNNVAYFPDL